MKPTAGTGLYSSFIVQQPDGARFALEHCVITWQSQSGGPNIPWWF